jgi:phage major head subunit gpT-like protein
MPSFQTTSTLAALKTRLHRDFQAALTGSPVHSQRLGLYSEMQSDTESNTYDWLASMAGMREWLGPRIVESFKERSFQIVNKHFEKTLEVNIDKLEDSPMTAVSDAAARLAVFMEGARKLDDDLLFNASSTAMGGVSGLLAVAATTVCYDGQYFFDTDHPTDLDSTGSQSNYESTGFALSSANFQTARARMMAFKGENGRPLGIIPNLLVVPPALEKTAHDIVTAEFGSSGATNVQRGMARVEVIPELSALSDTSWYLFDTVSPGPKPFILQNRKALQMVTLMGPTDAPVFNRNVYQWGIDRRCGAGFAIWQKAFKGVA